MCSWLPEDEFSGAFSFQNGDDNLQKSGDINSLFNTEETGKNEAEIWSAQAASFFILGVYTGNVIS